MRVAHGALMHAVARLRGRFLSPDLSGMRRVRLGSGFGRCPPQPATDLCRPLSKSPSSRPCSAVLVASLVLRAPSAGMPATTLAQDQKGELTFRAAPATSPATIPPRRGPALG
jgi:hypothetical protein